MSAATNYGGQKSVFTGIMLNWFWVLAIDFNLAPLPNYRTNQILANEVYETNAF